MKGSDENGSSSKKGKRRFEVVVVVVVGLSGQSERGCWCGWRKKRYWRGLGKRNLDRRLEHSSDSNGLDSGKTGKITQRTNMNEHVETHRFPEQTIQENISEE